MDTRKRVTEIVKWKLGCLHLEMECSFVCLVQISPMRRCVRPSRSPVLPVIDE
ncbi:predicted protein [Sclerotinia sclerotiorum 1980 UF-70]|uniref:Uncharacterized protein n=1 Tax=Sclerotinia sclerotiorum (strain ATCC 18683 / 1980 / Ss-1) TaxID=665079 RepID=A7ENV6_SCLS1|nr:predicted protein [Sclerotinia sclerotiorum 1980 UF-70]EDO04522.1 predicted protein [Sclerotinia sclerotiorum 1980 UF-70]